MLAMAIIVAAAWRGSFGLKESVCIPNCPTVLFIARVYASVALLSFLGAHFRVFSSKVLIVYH